MQKEKAPIGYEITVIQAGKAETDKIRYSTGMDILTLLQKLQIHISSACKGRGTCGKCRIKLLEGKLGISTEDRKTFSKDELEQGWRLACRAFPEGDCTILVKSADTEYDIITEHIIPEVITARSQSEYAVAIDIGTTTIAASLINKAGGITISSFSSVNSQIAYGADVITRINASNSGGREVLQDIARRDLLHLITELVMKSGIDKKQIRNIAIACNTVMRHLLLGYSCETLGRYPYTPVNIDTVCLSFEEIFGTGGLDSRVTVLPGISTFVGGDITAGLLACNFDRVDKVSIFIDLGTNAEMAVGNKEKILVCSAAAGPAFEGGNISSGMGSIAGAICSLRLENGNVKYDTIGDRSPVGICGSGVIEIASELLKTGLIDETGLLSGAYFKEGFGIAKDKDGKTISFTQKDVREIQLAKAAIRAGIETLLKHYNCEYGDIDTVWLAGGFGYKINLEKAVHIGLLPDSFLGRIKAAGNTSLGGAVQYLLDPSVAERVGRILKAAGEIQLSNDEYFNDLYIENMNFRHIIK